MAPDSAENVPPLPSVVLRYRNAGAVVNGQAAPSCAGLPGAHHKREGPQARAGCR